MQLLPRLSRARSGAVIAVLVAVGCSPAGSDATPRRAVASKPHTVVPSSGGRPAGIRGLAPVTALTAVPGVPSSLAPTLLAFGFDGPGIYYLYDTATRTGWRARLPQGYPSRKYRRWQTGPFYGRAERVGDRIAVSVGPKTGAAPRRLFTVADDLRGGESTRIPGRGTSFIPTRDGRNMWTFHTVRDHVMAVERDPDSGRAVKRLALPSPRAPVAEVAGGFLTVTTRGNDRASVLTVIHPNRPGEPTVITRNADTLLPVLSVRGSLIAWQGPGNCTVCKLKLTNLRIGRTRRVRWRPPQRFVCDQGALSPDGRWLAVGLGCPRPDGYGRAPVLIVNTATAQAHLVPGSAEPLQPVPHWSTDGHWVMWVHAGSRHTTIRAYRPGTRRPRSFTIPRNTPDFMQTFAVPGSPSRALPYNSP
ncbi:MAG: hypothetical protein JO246_07880 [Frankiaceae bacterium]|nr:hypothetical protein [Frankiaceae bacterium]MBV9870867.1 hypothetical protein [Frankiaceae bacterium]